MSITITRKKFSINRSYLEFEINMTRDPLEDFYDFKELDKFIEDICQKYESKHELHFKVTGIGF